MDEEKKHFIFMNAVTALIMYFFIRIVVLVQAQVLA
jgi:hypothetical protein